VDLTTHFPSSNAEDENTWSCTSTSIYVSIVRGLVSTRTAMPLGDDLKAVLTSD
jgi:hypothetical protein